MPEARSADKKAMSLNGIQFPVAGVELVAQRFVAVMIFGIRVHLVSASLVPLGATDNVLGKPEAFPFGFTVADEGQARLFQRRAANEIPKARMAHHGFGDALGVVISAVYRHKALNRDHRRGIDP